MSYACLSERRWDEGEYTLVPIRKSDMEQIRFWRNQQLEVLRNKSPLTAEMQMRYFTEVVEPQFHQTHPDQLLFSFLKEGRCIGYGGLTHIDWFARRAEVSFLLATEKVGDTVFYQEAFRSFLKALKKVVKEGLNLHRLFTETYAIRPFHVAALEQEGFLLEGRLRDHVWIEGHFVDALIHGYLCEEKNG